MLQIYFNPLYPRTYPRIFDEKIPKSLSFIELSTHYATGVYNFIHTPVVYISFSVPGNNNAFRENYLYNVLTKLWKVL